MTVSDKRVVGDPLAHRAPCCRTSRSPSGDTAAMTATAGLVAPVGDDVPGPSHRPWAHRLDREAAGDPARLVDLVELPGGGLGRHEGRHGAWMIAFVLSGRQPGRRSDDVFPLSPVAGIRGFLGRVRPSAREARWRVARRRRRTPRARRRRRSRGAASVGSPHLGLQDLAQREAGAVQPALEGALLESEDLGGLVGGQALHVAQDDGGAVVRGEAGERVLEAVA